MVDGCTPFGAFVRVVLPNAAPGLVATFVYAFLFAWDELLFAAALTQTRGRDDPDRDPQLHRQLLTGVRQLMAAGVVSTIPVMLAFFATQRWLVQGPDRRGGEGMTASLRGRSTTPDRLSAGLPLRRRDRGLPDRGRAGTRTAAASRSGTASAARPARSPTATRGDVACDHYHRWRGDLDLIAALGIESYRFSIAWPRVQPDGRGALNRGGVRFYRRLVEGLLERGIEPVATLYHWDLPQALQDSGGWAARDTTERFADYARADGRELGDLVAQWITHNEPWVVAFLGHAEGRKAPGMRDWPTALRVSHHLLRLARPRRAGAARGAPAGMPVRHHAQPASAAARRATQRPIARRPGSPTATRTAGSSTPCSTAATRRTCSSCSAASSGRPTASCDGDLRS